MTANSTSKTIKFSMAQASGPPRPVTDATPASRRTHSAKDKSQPPVQCEQGLRSGASRFVAEALFDDLSHSHYRGVRPRSFSRLTLRAAEGSSQEGRATSSLPKRPERHSHQAPQA